VRRRSLVAAALCAVGAASWWATSKSSVGQTLAAGITENHIRVDGVGFRVVRVDQAKAEIKLKWKDDTGNRIAALAHAMSSGGDRAVFATNAGNFDKSFAPLGLHVENGVEIHACNRDDGVGNFFWKPNAIFGVKDSRPFIVRSESYRSNENVELATQSGPMLIEHGKMLPDVVASSSSERLRSAVGISSAGEVVFILSIESCSFALLARAMQRLGGTDAMYLDGEISRFRTANEQGDGNFAAMLAVSSRP
jgi:uncharacterized protein YigE (DUF2233 family)